MDVENITNIARWPVLHVLGTLLKDRTTGRNIVWGTAGHETEQMLEEKLLEGPRVIMPRVCKSQEEQKNRTREKAEVFTPAWLCNRMNDMLDEEWYGQKYLFNTRDGTTWVMSENPVEYSVSHTWGEYVDLRYLEAACGEAPFLVSRYDASTAKLILPLNRRVGILDRKLRTVSNNTEDIHDWEKWALRAVEATYGYEYQGDSLLIARINILLTYLDYYMDRWVVTPDDSVIEAVAERLSWNLWQMDGLTNTVPGTDTPCLIYDWRKHTAEQFAGRE